MSTSAEVVKTTVIKTSTQKPETKKERELRYVKKYIECVNKLNVVMLNKLEKHYPELLKIVLEQFDTLDDRNIRNLLFEVLTIGSFSKETPNASDEKARLEIIQYLVQRAPHLVNLRSKEGVSPLHMAAAHGYLSIFKFLLSKGAKTSKYVATGIFTSRDEERFASHYNREQISSHIKKVQEVYFSVKSNDLKTLSETISSDRTLLFLCNEEGNGLLHLSLQGDNPDFKMAKILINFDIEFEHVNGYKRTVLQEAALLGHWVWIVNVLQYLEKKKKIESKKINEVLEQLIEIAEKYFSDKDPEKSYLRVDYEVLTKINKNYWLIFSKKLMEIEQFFSSLDFSDRLKHPKYEKHLKNMAALSVAVRDDVLKVKKAKDGAPVFTFSEEVQLTFSQGSKLSGFSGSGGAGKRARTDENDSSAVDPRDPKRAKTEPKAEERKEEVKATKQAGAGSKQTGTAFKLA